MIYLLSGRILLQFSIKKFTFTLRKFICLSVSINQSKMYYLVDLMLGFNSKILLPNTFKTSIPQLLNNSFKLNNEQKKHCKKEWTGWPRYLKTLERWKYSISYMIIKVEINHRVNRINHHCFSMKLLSWNSSPYLAHFLSSVTANKHTLIY